MIRACIFDLDGTLINTIDALKRTTNLVLDQVGCAHVNEEDIKRIVGDGFRNQLKRALAITGDPDLTHYDEAEALYPQFFAENCLYRIRAYDGICDLLEGLKAKGIKLAVLTNKPHDRAVENLDIVFGTGYFDYVLGEKAGIPKKPDPTGVHYVMDALKVRAEECLYFGDTNTDMKTGLGAGLTTIGVTWGFRSREELESFHPQYIISHPSEVLERILISE